MGFGGTPARPLEERLHTHADKQPGGCWIWRLAPNRDGYGVIAINGKSKKLAHRAMYEVEVGPIPEGMTLDHLCRVRNCVNPEHLEVVTQKGNVTRGKRLILCCPQGHPYTEENTRLRVRRRGVARECRICTRDRSAPTCRGGHEWSDGNTIYAADGRRQCVICRPPKRRAA